MCSPSCPWVLTFQFLPSHGICSVPTQAANASTHTSGTGAAPTSMGGDEQSGLDQRHHSCIFHVEKNPGFGVFVCAAAGPRVWPLLASAAPSQKRGKPNESQTTAVYLTAWCNWFGCLGSLPHRPHCSPDRQEQKPHSSRSPLSPRHKARAMMPLTAGG